MAVLVPALLLPMLLPMLLVGAEARHCPPDLCYESGEDPPPVVHGRAVRRAMRAFGPLRGRQPRWITTEGTRLHPSMSVATLERRLRADGANPAFRVTYGRCASHDEGCPWADIEVHLFADPSGFDCRRPPTHIQRVTRTASHVVLEYRPEGPGQSFEVSIGHGGCADDPRPAGDQAPIPTTAWVYIDGTHGLGHAALGSLPVRAIVRALAD